MVEMEGLMISLLSKEPALLVKLDDFQLLHLLNREIRLHHIRRCVYVSVVANVDHTVHLLAH